MWNLHIGHHLSHLSLICHSRNPDEQGAVTDVTEVTDAFQLFCFCDVKRIAPQDVLASSAARSTSSSAPAASYRHIDNHEFLELHEFMSAVFFKNILAQHAHTHFLFYFINFQACKHIVSHKSAIFASELRQKCPSPKHIAQSLTRTSTSNKSYKSDI